ncbi:MAG TPA: glycosyltransferase family 4 protein [Jatrophihabitans sp.]|nr:glycosyltransferase family 4 protein [Jatrophihabitans sp.]
MRILMLSWEYPPLVVGGLGRHVEALARELAAQGHDVRVVTRGDAPSRSREQRDGVTVLRAALDPLAIDFTTETLLGWSQASEHALVRTALPALGHWRPDVVHAHDWLVAQTAATVVEQTGAALVATLHASEAGRHQGWLPRPLNLAIHSVERWLAQRADAVITCSTTMQHEVSQLFELPAHHVCVIPNGIDATRWTTTARAKRAARDRFATESPLLVFAGRLVHEKGVQTLLRAIRPLREAHAGLRLVVAGAGVHEDALRAQARRLRIARSVEWLGFVPEADLPALLGAADAVVVPSLYEPFGIVALEAAVAATPLVVAETGGLRDLAAASVAAASFPAGDAEALASAVGKVLIDPAAARRTAARAARSVRRDFTWSAVARQTVDVYRRAAVTAPGGP